MYQTRHLSSPLQSHSTLKQRSASVIASSVAVSLKQLTLIFQLTFPGFDRFMGSTGGDGVHIVSYVFDKPPETVASISFCLLTCSLSVLIDGLTMRTGLTMIVTGMIRYSGSVIVVNNTNIVVMTILPSVSESLIHLHSSTLTHANTKIDMIVFSSSRLISSTQSANTTVSNCMLKSIVDVSLSDGWWLSQEMMFTLYAHQIVDEIDHLTPVTIMDGESPHSQDWFVICRTGTAIANIELKVPPFLTG